jgi:hypothetical protein
MVIIKQDSLPVPRGVVSFAAALGVGYIMFVAYAVQVWRYRIKILMSGLACHIYAEGVIPTCCLAGV